MTTHPIELNPLLREAISDVAAIYFKKTKRKLEITSGIRSPSRQADAMYVKLASGGSLAIYGRQALTQPIMAAYREGRKKRWTRERTVAAMANVIKRQMDEGHFLSRHLQGRAFDVRVKGMTGRQRSAFIQAVKQAGGLRLLQETKPPHFHIELQSSRLDE